MEQLGIEAADARYRQLVEAISDYAIYMLDADGHVASWNSGARRLKGYEPGEILGHDFACFYTPEERATGAPAKALATASAEGRFEVEGWRVRKDGSRFWAHVVIDTIREPATGQTIGYAKVTRDLSERRSASDALWQSEEQFRLLVQGVTDYAIYMLDPNGLVTSWNGGAQRIKGYTPEQIIGKHFSEFYTKEDRVAGVPQHNLEVARQNGRYESEGLRVRADGTGFIAHVVIDAIPDASGRIIGFAKVTRDVTERANTQAALAQAQTALFHAQKLESIGQLTGGVAHDFNNLLTAIVGSLEIALRRVSHDANTVRLLTNAMKAADRGTTLTQRMLAFARRQELTLGPVEIDALVDGLKELVERSIGPSINVRIQLALRLPAVTCDAAQLESALLNLMLNARDAMPSGGEITLSGREEWVSHASHATLPTGRYVVLAVADTGHGMDEHTLSHALEPFFTTKGVGKGTGLGLSMAHGLAEQSGGGLLLRSEAKRGTTVEMWLPVARARGADPLMANDRPGISPAIRQRTILAVDDDDLVLNNTVALLEDLGHVVLQASSGEEAVKLIAATPSIDLVVSDQAMPGMTGLQLVQFIASTRPSLPVILATGFAELPPGAPTDLRRLAKPFRQQQLSDAIEDVFARRE